MKHALFAVLAAGAVSSMALAQTATPPTGDTTGAATSGLTEAERDLRQTQPPKDGTTIVPGSSASDTTIEDTDTGDTTGAGTSGLTEAERNLRATQPPKDGPTIQSGAGDDIRTNVEPGIETRMGNQAGKPASIAGDEAIPEEEVRPALTDDEPEERTSEQTTD
jgi:hypothetical protein